MNGVMWAVGYQSHSLWLSVCMVETELGVPVTVTVLLPVAQIRTFHHSTMTSTEMDQVPRLVSSFLCSAYYISSSSNACSQSGTKGPPVVSSETTNLC